MDNNNNNKTANTSPKTVPVNECPELQLMASEYVQIREDAEYYYIDVGRSEEMNIMLTAAYERVQDLEDRCSKTLRTILTKLQAGQINPNSQQSLIMNTTPAKPKSKARAKRPAPQSSSINKVILHRAKATAAASASTSVQGQKLFTGSVDRIEANLEMMTEMSIDASKNSSKSKAKKKPFIAMEQSVVASGQTIADSSTSAVNTTTVRTRSQARLAAAGASTSKTEASANGSATMSSAKTSRSRKVADQQQQASGSFIRTNDSSSNLAAPAVKLTPSKQGRLIDLNGGGSVGKKKKPTATTASGSSVDNTTPAKQGRAGGAVAGAPGGTPSAARRQELEKHLQEKLVLSEDKRKKADENKKMLLETRAQRVKKDREMREEKFRQNKAALEQQQQAKTSASKPQTKQELRNAERRRKLAELAAQAKDEKKPRMTRAAAKKAAETAARQQQEQQQGSDSKSGDSKSKLKGTKATTAEAAKKVKKPAVKDAPMDSEPLPGPSGLSPIARTSSSAHAGINTRLNETFTTEAVTCSGPIVSGPQGVASTPAHSTLDTNGVAGPSNVTFAAPANPPPPSTPRDGHHNVAKKLLAGQTPTTYEMTPPPRERVFDNNYDISKYIDSEDEEEQAAYEKKAGTKSVPKWARGQAYINRIRAQFDKPPEELAAIQARIFPPPVLPVPLEAMGLPLREKYQQRSSSVNWKKSEVIADDVAKLNKNKNKNPPAPGLEDDDE